MKNPTVLLHTDAGRSAVDLVAKRHPDLDISLCDTHAALSGTLDAQRPEVVYSLRFPGDFPGAALTRAPSVRWHH